MRGASRATSSMVAAASASRRSLPSGVRARRTTRPHRLGQLLAPAQEPPQSGPQLEQALVVAVLRRAQPHSARVAAHEYRDTTYL